MKTIEQLRMDSDSILYDIAESKKQCELRIKNINVRIDEWNEERDKELLILNELKELEKNHK